ncbi:glucokinase [Chitinophaga nivalis]|uniref:Glucokinase n=1 Tax=Chitinophaga nivalis TaxID=2991709 RepID=A0ABT3IKX0_9BACT|nr:glucokinase [Chitinophaga nivalis]MCW3465697.1 glucokinase [Chitinophaga nivalis]MCW3484612.1 glucokinase [Chitinophaga nivalis]
METLKKQHYLPRFIAPPEEAVNNSYLLAGDLGGTKTNLALFKASNGALELIREHKYASREYASFSAIIHHFIGECGQTPPQRICIGVAGPVVNGKVELTNLSRELSEAEIRQHTGINKVALINDLEATAYGLATLTDAQLTTLHRGSGNANGNMAIIAPGTGLGMAGLYWDGTWHHPFPTEGGHTDFAPRTDLDILLLRYLQEKYEIVSCERLVSGPGISDIFQFLRDVKGMEVPHSLQTAMQEGDPAAALSQSAISGNTAIAVKTMELFVRYLAREACNLVLKMKATGGLFLGGGIPPKIAALLETGDFYHHYMQGDRMAELLASVPIHIVNNDKTALWGAAYYAEILKD